LMLTKKWSANGPSLKLHWQKPKHGRSLNFL
jgi:hypothetical protein